MSNVPTVNGKPWYTSKTLWFNGLVLVLGAAEMNFKLLEQHIPGSVFTVLAFVLSVGNVLLRFITTTALIIPRVDPPAPPAPPGQAGFISLQALVWAAILAVGLFFVWDSGRDSADAKWLKKQAAQQKVDQDERDRLARLAAIAAQFEIDEQRRSAERSAHLLGVMKHARSQFPLLAKPLGVAGAAGAGGACPSGAVRPGAAAPGELEGYQAGPEIALVPWPVPVDPDLTLTLGAVWLWNAALSGQTDLAAGACRIDATTGQADPACSQPSGLDLDAAFANQAANAAACREDRARHQRLIDYLHSLSPTLLSK
jgi:hypothetical protein